MISILSNTMALTASRHLGTTNLGLQRTLQRLTTGRRVNSALDDSTALGSGNQFAAIARKSFGETQQAQAGVSWLNVPDQALDQVTSLLFRGFELAAQGGSGADVEYQAIQAQINSLLTQTQAGGVSVFGSSTSSNVVVSGAGSTVANEAAAILAEIAGGNTPYENGWNVAFASAVQGSTPDIAVTYGMLGFWYLKYVVDAWQSAFDGLPIAQADASAAMNAANNLRDAYPTDSAVIALWSMANYAFNNPSGPSDNLANAIATAMTASNSVSVVVPVPTPALNISVGGFPPVNLITDASSIPTNLGSVATAAGATAALATLTTAMNALSAIRGDIGSRQQQLSSMASTLGIRMETNTQLSDAFLGADMALEMGNLTKYQILQQAGQHALTQANSASRFALALFA